MLEDIVEICVIMVDHGFQRIMIDVECLDYHLSAIIGPSRTSRSLHEQIESQLNKVEDVISVTMLDPERTVCRELFLIRTFSENAAELKDYDCRVLSQNEHGTVYELCGSANDLENFCIRFGGADRCDIARTGITAVET